MKNLILILLSCLVFVSCSTQTKPPSCSNDVAAQSVIPNESCVALEAEDPTSFSVQLWGQKNKFWPKNTNIRVLFLNGTETQKNETWKRIKLVDDLISIKSSFKIKKFI